MNPEQLNEDGFTPASYKIRADGTIYNLSNAEPTAEEILKLIGKAPSTHVLIMLVAGQEKRTLAPDDNLDLRQPGIEEFTFASTLREFILYIDETRVVFNHPDPTGLELLQKVGKSPHDFALTQILPGEDDEFIEPEEKVDLTRKGIEKFTTVIFDEITIFVNARPKAVKARSLSFAQIVALAQLGASTTYTVSYRKGRHSRPEGTLVDGDTIKIKEGMIFNVSATNQS